MTLSKRQIRVLVVVGVILGVIVGPAVATFIAEFATTSGTIPLRANNGPTVLVKDHGGEVNLTQPFVDDNTIDLETANGNATLKSAGATNVTINQVTGTWTNTTALDVSSNELYIDPEDKPAINVSGDADTLNWTTMAVDDGKADFVYSGASGTTTVTVRGLDADTQVGAVDVATNEVLATGTTDGSGTVTLSGMPNSEHTVELQTSEGAPVIKENTASPTGNLSTQPSELSINVTDSDFPNDNVTVKFYLNGSLLATKHITSGGEVTASIGTIDSRTHTWNVTAEDEYGNTDTSSEFTFSTPGELSIYRETEPDTLINDRQVNLTIFADDEVHTRNTTDGNVSLTGLPTEDLVIRAEANGYHTRTIVLESLVDQPRIYLMNTSVDTANVTFLLEDKTGGNFPPETTQLFIKKPITRNGTTTYETVVADEFGTNGVSAQLEKDQRYRLVVKNQDNDERVLGPFTATKDEIVTLTVGSLTFESGDTETYLWEASYNESGGSPRIKFDFSDPDDATTDLNVVICERGNCSNNTIYNETISGPLGNASVTQLLSASQENKTWVVKFEAERNGEPIEGQRVVGKNVGPGVPLDPFWKEVAAVGLLIVLAGAFGAGMRSPEAAGIVISLVAGIFWQIGWLPSAIGGGAVVVGLTISGLMLMAKSRGAAT